MFGVFTLAIKFGCLFLGIFKTSWLRYCAHQSQRIGWDADVNHTQIIGGIQSNYWGDISPPGFGTPGFLIVFLNNNRAVMYHI